MQETLFRGRSKAKSPCRSSIAYRSKAITPPRSGGSYPQVAEVEIAEAIEAGVVDPSYPDEEPAQVAVYLIEFTLFRYIAQHICREQEHIQSQMKLIQI